jgi:hypothetical protein
VLDPFVGLARPPSGIANQTCLRESLYNGYQWCWGPRHTRAGPQLDEWARYELDLKIHTIECAVGRTRPGEAQGGGGGEQVPFLLLLVLQSLTEHNTR